MRQCDYCKINLEGFGVLYGLVASHLVDDQVEELIFCYLNECRTVALRGLVNIVVAPGDPVVRCVDGGSVLPERSLAYAMLTTDLDPDGGLPRYLQFCYEGGSRDRLLANVGRTA